MKFFFVLSLLCSFYLLFWLVCFLCSTSLVKVIGFYTEDEPIKGLTFNCGLALISFEQPGPEVPINDSQSLSNPLPMPGLPHYQLNIDRCIVIEPFSVECHKTKTKVITLSRCEPIRMLSKHTKQVPSAGKHMQARHNLFWFCFPLVEKVAQVLSIDWQRMRISAQSKKCFWKLIILSNQ